MRNEWMKAFKRASPFLLSALVAGTVFGALAMAGGLSVFDSLMMSGFVYSGSAQFVGLQLITSHTELAVVLATTVLLSLRFFLYSMSLLDEVKSIPVVARAVLAFGLIDQVFFLVRERYKEPGSDLEKHMFFFACVLIFYLNWMLGTAIGLYLGESLSRQFSNWGLNFLTCAAFIAMLGSYLRVWRNLGVIAFSVVIFVLTHRLPYNLAIVVSCVGGVMCMRLLETLRKK